MTIDKAIKILKKHALTVSLVHNLDTHVSIYLGIEALKYYQQERERRGSVKTMWLPGETKE